MFTVANMFTALRMLLAPVFFYFIITNKAVETRIAVLMFGVAALTDFFDGYMARKLGEMTEFGVFLDPLADKVLVLSALLSFVFIDIVPLWMVVVIIVRDVGTTLMRVYADAVKMPVATSRSAKWKTALQMIFIFYVLILHALKLSTEIPDIATQAGTLLDSPATYLLMLTITVITVWTLVEYILDNSPLFRRMFSLNQKS
jgi:CDP-diacylglycerol---glycerol-3-phosphate 3-phosphatidyltransferase